MAFHSYLFVLLFLPLAVTGVHLLGRFSPKASRLFLLGMSAWFYLSAGLRNLPVLAASLLLNFTTAVLLPRFTGGRKKAVFLLGLGFNIGALVYFKYWGFLCSFLPFPSAGTSWLPLGISFFTFQQIAFLADVYRNEAADYRLSEYAAYVLFFPHISSGPITYHHELIPQLRDPERQKLCWDNLSRGMFLFCIGLAKKILLADTFGQAANAGFAADGLNSIEALVSALSYGFQLYFDFSGYSDMAVGIAKMLGYDLPLNFNSPYKAKTISQFWDRWHMTLTRFFTKYIYIPLGGSRQGVWKTCRNIFLVFLVSGLWHGANWTFLLWGALHGAASIAYRLLRRYFDRIPGLIQWMLTFSFVTVTWIFFRADSVSRGWQILSAVLSGGFGPIRNEIHGAFLSPELLFVMNRFYPVHQQSSLMLPLAFLALAFVIVLAAPSSTEMTRRFQPTLWRLLLAAVLLVWSVYSFSGVSTFLYAGF